MWRAACELGDPAPRTWEMVTRPMRRRVSDNTAGLGRTPPPCSGGNSAPASALVGITLFGSQVIELGEIPGNEADG